LKRNELTGKSKLVFFKSAFESVEKLSTKDNTEYFDGQKELVSTGNPTPLIGREPATRDDAMQMGMMPSTPTIPRARKIRMSKSSIHSTRSMVLAFKSSAGRSVETARCLSPIQLGGG
jgi:hypothetical protein